MTTTRRQYERIMTEYSRLLHASSSESEVSSAAPGTTITPDGKVSLNSNRKKRSQRSGNQVPAMRINYIQSPMAIEQGDWVVRLREGDPAAMAKLDETDIWDGPFNVIELPSATGDENRNEKAVSRVKLRFPSGSKADPWTAAGRLIPVYPEPPRREEDASGAGGVIFHLRKGSSIFVEIQPFRPVGKRGEELYVVGCLRDRRVSTNRAETEYLVHWAGWPSEDDSWEKANGIPESFREEYDMAKTRNDAGAGSKAYKARKMKSPVKSRDSSAISAVKDETLIAGKKQRSRPESTAVKGSGSPAAGRGSATRQRGFGSSLRTSNTAAQKDTSLARAIVGTRRRTPEQEPHRPRAPAPESSTSESSTLESSTSGSPTLESPSSESSRHRSVSGTLVSRLLGKRHRTRADHQEASAEAVVGKRRRL